MILKNSDLIKRDLAHIFHPCTQMRDHNDGLFPLIPIKYANDVFLYDFEGNSYIDAISSWWTNLFGHSNEHINKKLKEQLESLEHIIFAGFTHEPAVRLAERVVKIAPKGLKRLFFADNGSSGIEVALKMSFHAHKNRGESRALFVSLENGYHGETLGALSIGDLGLYKDAYKEIVIKTLRTPAPKDTTQEAAKIALEQMEQLFETHKNEISAFIIEPLVQCAGGMRMQHPSFVSGAHEICRHYGVHLIADEVAVGFGRSGSMFACEQSGVTPDFMVLSKGLTGGYLPLSVVLFTDEVYEAFYCDYQDGKSFLHSHSYTGNPLSCTAANATLDIFENYDILGDNAKKSHYIGGMLSDFKKLSNVIDVRSCGMIFAVELGGYTLHERVNLKIYNYAIKNGVLLRPLGSVLYFMPPYTIAQKEIDRMLDVGYDAVRLLSEGRL